MNLKAMKTLRGMKKMIKMKTQKRTMVLQRKGMYCVKVGNEIESHFRAMASTSSALDNLI